MSDDERKEKFVGCAQQVLNEASITRIIEYVDQLEKLEDIRPMCRLLVGEM